MNTFTKTLAVASTLAVMAASTAFADPYVGPENEQQYQVSSQEVLSPYVAAKPNAAMTSPAARPVLTTPTADPHWGPAFDPDVD
ncbi:hypothetical protein ABLE91_21820 [Aquabacter sp. CN5-332]|uniref:hypothetical protein n=1 Tax=Aquabacter sp. CN5-332 TaxID=3156608 RepID=UPI0032B58CDB